MVRFAIAALGVVAISLVGSANDLVLTGVGEVRFMGVGLVAAGLMAWAVLPGDEDEIPDDRSKAQIRVLRRIWAPILVLGAVAYVAGSV